MKYIVCSLVLALGFTACKKDLGACKEYKEAPGRQQLLDPAGIDFKPFRDTLEKYPQLQAVNYRNDAYSKNLSCNIYYKDLLIFSDTYSLYQNTTNDTIRKFGTIPVSPPAVSLSPGISYKDAITNAKRYANFDHSCISYQLGLFNLNYGGNNTPDYRLAWKIMGSGTPEIWVISDAHNNQIFQVSNGRYWVY